MSLTISKDQYCFGYAINLIQLLPPLRGGRKHPNNRAATGNFFRNKPLGFHKFHHGLEKTTFTSFTAWCTNRTRPAPTPGLITTLNNPLAGE